MTIKPSIALPEAKSFKPRFARRMALLLVPTSILLTVIMGGLVYLRSSGIVLEQANKQIGRFISQVEDQLDDWLLLKQQSFSDLSSTPSFQTTVDQIHQAHSENNNYSAQRIQLLNQLAQYQSAEGVQPFDDFVLINEQGTILVSTIPSWEGSSLSSQDYYSRLTDSADTHSFFRFSAVPFNQGDTSEEYDVILITATQLTDNQGNQLGYLLGLSASPSIQAVLEANSGYLPDNNLFLVNENGEFAGITDQSIPDSLTLHSPNTAQEGLVYAGLSEELKATEYTSTDGANVLGLYTFYTPLNIGFVVEYPFEAPLLTNSNVGVQVASIIIAFTIVIAIINLFLSYRLTAPLKELVQRVEKFTKGDWEIRANSNRDDEIGMLGASFNNLADELNNFYQNIQAPVSDNKQQLISASEISMMATSSASMDEMLDRIALLITERFEFIHTAIYTLDQSREIGKLRAATGGVGKNLIAEEYQIEITPGTSYFMAIQHNEARIADEAEGDFLDLDLIPGAKAKALIPISIGMDVFGLIDVQCADSSKFNQTTIDMLQNLANQLAVAIQNFRTLEGTEVDLQQVSELFTAGQEIAQARTEDEVFKAIVSGVQQTSFYAAFYVAHPSGLTLLQPVENKPFYSDQLPTELPLSKRLTYMFFEENEPIVIKDVKAPLISIRPEMLQPALSLECIETALIPVIIRDDLQGLLILSSREAGKITHATIQPFLAFSNMAVTGLDKVLALKSAQQTLQNFQTINDLSNTIGDETDPEKIYPVIHNQIRNLLGDVDFFIALYDRSTDFISIPYIYEGENRLNIDPFPLGEGLTSIVIRTRKPLMIVERAEERAISLGAKIIGEPAKSWLGIPLMIANEVIGIISVQDIEREFRFTNDDLILLTTLSTTIASAIRSATLLSESENRAVQLQTVAEISRETSSTLDRDELLTYALQLIQERFDFYHASVFIMDSAGEFAIVEESTGEAGKQMKAEGHRLKVGSQSVIGYVTENLEPLVVNDVTQDPTHRFNPLLPDTRSELGIPIVVGGDLLGALDVQSTQPYAFSQEDIEILQILADQLAIAINNAELFTTTQEHLAQHRLIHHVTTVAASSTNIQDALSSAVQGLRVTLGDRISILVKDTKGNTLRVQAAAGYDNDVLGMRINIGQGITGWAAEHREAVIVNDVEADPRYISGNDAVRSEMAVPLVYRGELLGVLNIESDQMNAFDEHDQDILGTLAGSLSAIIVNTRLSERQRQLFDITSKIRQSVSMETILETTAAELNKALRTRRTRIKVGGAAFNEPDSGELGASPVQDTASPSSGNGQEGEE